MEIGARLKEAREANDISLDSLQEATKIQKRYLLAIEQGNLHLLPGKFYARAFIKEYATAVGIDPNELLAGYQDVQTSIDEENREVELSRAQRTRQQDSELRNPVFLSIIPKIIVGLLVVGIIFAAIYFYQKQTPNGDPGKVEQPKNDEIIRNKDAGAEKPKDDLPVDDEDQDESNDVQDGDTERDNKQDKEQTPDLPEPELKLIKAGTGNRPESTFEFKDSDEKIMLTFKPIGVSWLDVKNEKGTSLLGINTTANTPIELDITDQTQVRINVGNTNELPVITINGIDIEFPADSLTQSFWIYLEKEIE